MNNPDVSILVPICNVQKYLRECLNSLVKQTLDNIQIICIDDGSTDCSPQIIEEFRKKDSRVEVISKPNSGYGDSMNQGLKAAKGTYVGIVESDDFAELNMFESLFNIATSNNVDIVKSNYKSHKTIDVADDDVWVENLVGVQYDSVLNPLDEIEAFMKQPAIWSALYRREFLVEKDIWFLPTPGASFQDTSFNFRALALANSVIYVKEGYLHYRIDNSNSSVKSQAKVFSICAEYENMWEFLENNPELYKKLSKVLPQIQFGGYKWNLDRLIPKLQYDFYKRFISEFKDLETKNLLDETHFNEPAWKTLTAMLKDPDGYFTKNYGPIAVDRSAFVSITNASTTSTKNLLRTICDSCGPNDEIYYLNVPSSGNVLAWNELKSIDSRLFPSETVLSCVRTATVDKSSLRGKTLTVVALDSVLTKKEIEAFEKSLKTPSASSRAFEIASSDITELPEEVGISIPMMLTGFCSNTNVSGQYTIAHIKALLEHLSSHEAPASEYIESLQVFYSAASHIIENISEKDGDITSALKVFEPIWRSLKEFYNALWMNEKLVSGALKPSARNLPTIEMKRARTGADPLVSVIMPVFNTREYLDDAISSLKQQTDVRFEVICVDDGSTDDSLSALLELTKDDDRFNVYTQLNSGAAEARNFGIQQAKGAYCAFIDPDDLYASNDVLSVLTSKAIDHDANVCGGSLAVFNIDRYEDSFRGDNACYTFREEGWKNFSDYDFDYGWIRFIYKRSFLVENEIVFPNLSFYEDPVFLTEVMEKSPVYYAVPKVVYLYREGHKDASWNAYKIRDYLQGIKHNLLYAARTNNNAMYSRIATNLDWNLNKETALFVNDEEVLYMLAELQAMLEPERTSFLKERYLQRYLINPLVDPIVKRPKPRALERLSGKLADSAPYKKAQSIYERIRNR